jgi:hypothetical protein
MRKLKIRTLEDVEPTLYLDECIPIDCSSEHTRLSLTVNGSPSFIEPSEVYPGALVLGRIGDGYQWEIVVAECGTTYLVAVKK